MLTDRELALELLKHEHDLLDMYLHGVELDMFSNWHNRSNYMISVIRDLARFNDDHPILSESTIAIAHETIPGTLRNVLFLTSGVV